MRRLPGPVVELRCRVPRHIARERYRARRRDERHLDGERTDDELWGCDVAPLGVGALLDVETSEPVDVTALTAQLTAVIAAQQS